MVSENKKNLWEAYNEWFDSAEGRNKIEEAFQDAEMVDICSYLFAGYSFEAGYKLAVKRLQGSWKIIS